MQIDLNGFKAVLQHLQICSDNSILMDSRCNKRGLTNYACFAKLFRRDN